MDASKKFMDEHGGSFLRFVEDVPVTVKLLKDKPVKIPNQFGKGDVDGMRYLVEINGEQTTFQTAAFTLISVLANCKEGDVVTITKVKRGIKTVYTVKRGEEDISSSIADDDDEVEGEGEPTEEPGW